MPVVAIPGNRTLAAMHRGLAIHLQHIGGRRHRRLSNGQTIHAAVAAIIIINNKIRRSQPATALFSNLLAQTWRMKND